MHLGAKTWPCYIEIHVIVRCIIMRLYCNGLATRVKIKDQVGKNCQVEPPSNKGQEQGSRTKIMLEKN